MKIWGLPTRRKKVDADPKAIAKLIEDLDDEDFDVRKSAHRELRRIGPAAKEQLTKASESNSLEAAFRARTILDEMYDRDMAPLHVIQGRDDFHGVDFSPAGRVLATGAYGSNRATCTLWRLDTTPKRFDLPNKHITSVVRFSPDGKQLAQGTRDGTILLHNVEDVLSK